MLHLNRIINALEFIEENLEVEFSLEDVSKSAFSSLSYMHRIFYQVTGLTMKEYIRLRRLALSVSLLQNTKKSILDIALTAGYQTYESFSRAFKRQFLMSPSCCRKNLCEVEVCQPFDLMDKYSFDEPDHLDFNLTLKSVTLPKLTIIGFETKTSMKQNKHIVDICNFANHYLQGNVLQRVFDFEKTDIYGVYTNMTDQDEFNYTIGGLKDACLKLDDNMTIQQLPSATYAKFTLDRNDRIKEAWHYIYGIWFPKIHALRAKGYDFEIYHTNETSIYIPMTEVPASISKYK